MPCITLLIDLSDDRIKEVPHSHKNRETPSEELIERFTFLSLVIGKLKSEEFLFVKSFPDIFPVRCHVACISFVQPGKYTDAINTI